MRKFDVFGKRVTRFSVFLWTAVFFLIILAGYFLILRFHAAELVKYEQERQKIENQINALLNRQEEEQFYKVADIIQYLPNEFNQNQTAIEIELLRNLSGLADASGYKITFVEDTVSPFTNTLPSTVRFVSISISMTAPDVDSILVFIQNIQNQNNIFYIKNFNLTIGSDGRASVQIILYTFYNDFQI